MAYAGEICSLGAAIVWAVAVILFRKSGQTTSPFSLNLFRVGASAICLSLILLAAGGFAEPGVSRNDILILSLSGIIGIALSDTLFHRCLNMVGAGINAIVDTLYSPLVAVMAFVLLGERLRSPQVLGMLLVISGVILTSRGTAPEGTTPRELTIGILFGVGAMATLALGIVIAKPVLEQHSVLWASAVRQIASFAAMAPIALALKERGRIWSVFRPRADWKYTLPGTLLGSVIALLLWLAGMKYIEAGTAAILNQTSTIFVLILASIFLHEAFTLRRWAAVALAFGGIALVTLG